MDVKTITKGRFTIQEIEYAEEDTHDIKLPSCKVRSHSNIKSNYKKLTYDKRKKLEYYHPHCSCKVLNVESGIYLPFNQALLRKIPSASQRKFEYELYVWESKVNKGCNRIGSKKSNRNLYKEILLNMAESTQLETMVDVFSSSDEITSVFSIPSRKSNNTCSANANANAVVLDAIDSHTANASERMSI